MRERAQLVNGTIDVQSAPGRGTTVTLKMPVASALPRGGWRSGQPAPRRERSFDV
jgi:hypothetical protein